MRLIHQWTFARMCFLTIALALVTACGTLGTTRAVTYQEKRLEAFNLIEGVAKGSATLRAAGKLSNSDRDNVVKSLEAAVAGIDLADVMHKTDAGAGMSKLQAQIAIVTALQTYLALKEK